MKRITTCVLIIALIIFIIDWGIIGVKLLDGDYDIIPEAYIGAACFTDLGWIRLKLNARIAAK